MNFRKIFLQNISELKIKIKSIHCKTATLHFLASLMLTAQQPCHLLIVVHVTCHPVTPPIQNLVLHLLKKKQTTILAIINIENLRETVSQIYSLSKATVLSCLPITNCQTTVFLKSLHIIPPIQAATFFP